ncbi:MAG: TIGR04282 family arsenosugar biosynthesis glycosyltransferase [Gemmatimonadota bacterium]
MGAKPGKKGKPVKPPKPRAVVVVFAKAVVAGQVKTRMRPVLQAAEAADLYRALLLDTLEAVRATDAEAVVAFTPANGRSSLERLLGRRWPLVAQGPGDLGERLESVFAQLHASSKRPLIAIGSDCPGVTPARLREAFAALDTHAAVLGPALDGGYYLLGLTAPRRELFRDISWSTADVAAVTQERLGRAGVSLALLPAERDLDTPADLLDWYTAAHAGALRATYARTWAMVSAVLPPRRLAALEEAAAR